MKTGIVILAAGSSSRLGQPKQLLHFQGKTLLRRMAEEALRVEGAEVRVVLGAGADRMREELAGLAVRTVVNQEWKTGMAGSIRVGLQDLLRLEQCILAVCDQPYVNAALFEQLIENARESGKGIVATGFSGTWGVPVLFNSAYFEKLLLLEGQNGAKQLIKDHPNDLAVLPFEPAAIDIDTVEDCFHLASEMVSVEEAKKNIDFYVPDSGLIKEVALQESLGYVLAEDVTAACSIPAFAQSSMDGYAFRFADREKALGITDEIPAGSTEPKNLNAGEAMRIFTGAPLPAGADTVVMQEKIEKGRAGRLLIKDPDLNAGENVRPVGSEVEKGAVAIKQGSLLTPAAIGYLAGMGCATVSIYTPPRVALVLTGNELRSAGQPLQLGEVYESNSYQLTAAMKLLGINDCRIFQVRDDLNQLKNVIGEALETCDVLLLVGGVSVGDYDYVVQAARACGIQQRFHRVRQKPGKPLFFGTRGHKPVFGLPGNPGSALTCYYLYVADALKKMMHLPLGEHCLKARVTADYPKKPGLTHFLKARLEGDSVTPLHAQESYRLQSYAEANALIVLPENSEGCKAGEEVNVYLINP